MNNISQKQINDFNKTRQNPKFLCNAPFCAMNISPTGIASPCCYNITLCDDYSKRSITEIFNGKIYKQYRKSIKKGIFPDACAMCRNGLLNREYDSLQILDYDYFKVSKIFRNKIRNISIALSNVCNLECIMCNGVHSSCIRKNREKLDPINIPYKHKFRTELKPLLPEMQTITFSIGGEPFLDSLFYTICEDIIELNPECSICVTTNGTILNDKIKQLLENGKFNINVSFNGITKETYEAVHINANYEETKANIKYFGDYMKKNNRILTLSFLPLKLNKFEIPDIVRFSNQNNFLINIGKIRGAVDVALFSSTEEDLIEIRKYYKNQEFEETNYISKRNISEFKDLVRRIDYWIELAKKKKDFINLFDLNTDKVDYFEKQLFNNIENTLNTISNDNNEAQQKMLIIKKKMTECLSKLPTFYKTNHFYKRLLSMGHSFAFIEYFLYGDSDWLCKFCNEIFYYELNHN